MHGLTEIKKANGGADEAQRYRVQRDIFRRALVKIRDGKLPCNRAQHIELHEFVTAELERGDKKDQTP